MMWEEARKQAQIDVEILIQRFRKRGKNGLCPEILAIRVLLAKERLLFKQLQGGMNGTGKTASRRSIA